MVEIRIACGRYTRTSSRDVIANAFGVAQFINVDFNPRYNIAPSQTWLPMPSTAARD